MINPRTNTITVFNNMATFSVSVESQKMDLHFCISLSCLFIFSDEDPARGKITSCRILSVTGSNKTWRDFAWIANAKTAALRLRNGDEGGVRQQLQCYRYRQYREETIIGIATRPAPTIMISARRHFLINTCSSVRLISTLHYCWHPLWCRPFQTAGPTISWRNTVFFSLFKTL